MTKGKLRKTYPDGGSLEASIGPDGWESASTDFRDFLAAVYPSGDTVAGVGWVRVFWEAQKALGAEVITLPVPADEPPGVIH